MRTKKVSQVVNSQHFTLIELLVHISNKHREFFTGLKIASLERKYKSFKGFFMKKSRFAKNK